MIQNVVKIFKLLNQNQSGKQLIIRIDILQRARSVN